MRFFLSIDSVYSLTNVDQHRRILRAWLDLAPELFPNRYAVDGAPRTRLEPARLEGALSDLGGRAWDMRRTGQPTVNASISHGLYHHGGLDVDGEGDSSVGASLRRVLLDAWCEILRPDYAVLHPLTRPEVEEALAAARPDVGIERFEPLRTALSPGGTRPLQLGLKSIYWVNVFGPAYVDLIGRSVLESAPAELIESHPERVVLQATSEPPTDDTYPAFKRRRDAIRAHLGEVYFWPNARRHPPSFDDFCPIDVDRVTR